MALTFVDECVALLTRTPVVLDALLRDLPEELTAATEGPGTWSPYIVLGHLIHTERTSWMTRITTILEHGQTRQFDPVDREAHIRQSEGEPLSERLDGFRDLRRESLLRFRSLNLQPEQLELVGSHAALGPVTVRQVLATWTAHDMAHTLQINRILALRYREEVGPFAQYLSVMQSQSAAQGARK